LYLSNNILLQYLWWHLYIFVLVNTSAEHICCFWVIMYCSQLINFIVLTVMHVLFLCNTQLLQYLWLRSDIIIPANILPENIDCFCVTINCKPLIKIIVLLFFLYIFVLDYYPNHLLLRLYILVLDIKLPDPLYIVSM
jgi:hypothetical protein